MNYLFYGLDLALINREIKKIIEKNNIDNINISEYDLDDTLLDNIIDDAQTISLFESKKLIKINNSSIFSSSTKKKNLPHNIDLLINYVNNSNPDTILIFILNEEKIDERKKISKIFHEKSCVIECNEIKDINSFVKQELNDYKMDNQTIQKFIDYVGKDISVISNEIEKLKLYKNEKKVINLEDIYLVCCESVSLDLNELTNSIVSKNKKQALKIYNNLIVGGAEPIQVVIRLANQFRIIYQSKRLSSMGYSNKDIAATLKIHPFRVKKAMEIAYNYSSKTLLELIKKLSLIDEQIKTSYSDKNISLELFILNL